MSNKKRKLLKNNLITFLTLFDGKPNMLVEYLMEYDILDDKLISLLINNKELLEKSKELKEKGELEKPYFTSIEEIQAYYSKFFVYDNQNILHPLLGSASKQEALILEIKKAIQNEDYETCAKIRDYCKKNKIELNI